MLGTVDEKRTFRNVLGGAVHTVLVRHHSQSDVGQRCLSAIERTAERPLVAVELYKN